MQNQTKARATELDHPYRPVTVSPANRWGRHIGVEFGHIVMQRIERLHVISVYTVQLNAAVDESITTNRTHFEVAGEQQVRRREHLPTGHWGAVVSHVGKKGPVILSLRCIHSLQHVQNLRAVVCEIIGRYQHTITEHQVQRR